MSRPKASRRSTSSCCSTSSPNLRDQKLTILIVEQNVHHVLRTADRAYVLENGRIVMQGEGAELLNDERLKVAYLGL